MAGGIILDAAFPLPGPGPRSPAMTTHRAFPLAALAIVALLAAAPSARPAAGAWRRLDPDIAWGEPAAIVDPAGDRLVVLPDRLDAIWTLDLAAPTQWVRRPVARGFDGGRDGQPLIHDEAGKRWIWVRLGGTNRIPLCEIWTLDTESDAPAWALVAQGMAPGRRHFASVVFGGGARPV